MVEAPLTFEEIIEQQEIVTDIFKSKPLDLRSKEELDLLHRQSDRVVQRTIEISFNKAGRIPNEQYESLVRGGITLLTIREKVEEAQKNKSTEK